MYQGDEQSQIDLRLFRIWLKASKIIFDNVSKDIERHGISTENFMILELLYNKGPQTVQKISEKLSIPSGSITYFVDKLEKKEYVKREPSPTDRRASIVVLADKGQCLFDEIFPKHVEVISKNVSSLSNEEKVQLMNLLKTLGLGASASDLK
ncbi:MarR family transcriptional regulator, 2-MHQ and catechol-resistance regulon repressor [Paenibacillus sp. yr247]|uniref:MarR family winged helix-turn-helix transcriptional regulator n=1 Tax=Paenibacillus sp. yr247 TaxID=1761880 RepID=UPI0008812CD3|nr:MarR family transcriptional regulator [Paenibacillus sp. yr247]SDN67784.1 MarR family transcriptional regulator, 2-MHQ and catechol-resistance regulon repressor [Paenibacillus sp. yr247]